MFDLDTTEFAVMPWDVQTWIFQVCGTKTLFCSCLVIFSSALHLGSSHHIIWIPLTKGHTALKFVFSVGELLYIYRSIIKMRVTHTHTCYYTLLRYCGIYCPGRRCEAQKHQHNPTGLRSAPVVPQRGDLEFTNKTQTYRRINNSSAYCTSDKHTHTSHHVTI